MKDSFKLILMLFLLISTSLQAGNQAQLKVEDFTNQNVLNDTVRTKKISMVKYLIQQGIDINHQDKYGYTSLHLAVRLGQFDIASYLIKNHANLNTTDIYGDSPLIDSIRNNNTKISKLLICNGANRNVVDNNGITTLQNSTQNKNSEIINLLRIDNLKPYCQDVLTVDIDPIKVTKDNLYSDTISGNITNGYANEINVSFKNKDDKIFGPFPAEVNNETKRWSINVKNITLNNGRYQVIVSASDYVPNKFEITKTPYIYAPKLDISFDKTNSSPYAYPRICGKINSDAIDTVKVLIEDNNQNSYGIFNAEISDKEKKWCADITNKLPHGYYNIKVHATDLYGQYIDLVKKDYLIDTKAFSINIEQIKEKNNLPYEVCINSNKPTITNIKVKFIDENNMSYSLTPFTSYKINKISCLKIDKTLPKGIYTIEATAQTKNKEVAVDLFEEYHLGNNNKIKPPKITVNHLEKLYPHKPKICGDILFGDITKGKMTVTDQKKHIKEISDIVINTNSKTWCSQLTQKLNNGKYKINIEVINKQRVKTNKTENITIYTVPELYNALRSEFKEDLNKWNATIDQDNLTFTFRNTNSLFTKDNSKITEEFENILNDFFPRYINVTSKFQKNIKNIIVKGYSPSKNKVETTSNEKLKQVISRNQAQNVLSYVNNIVHQDIANNIVWIIKTLKYDALSSSNLIYNTSTIEFKILSVDSKISK